MASYETEHARDEPRTDRPRRPDYSSLYNLISEIQPSEDRNREHAVPVPGDVSAAYRHLADAFRSMQQDNDNDSVNSDLLQTMISNLLTTAEHPPTEIKGVDEEYIADLERVPIKKMKSDADCPICGNEFREDPYPLLVRLPCHESHVFDLECIRPWLLLNGTCPLDRVDLAKKERERKKKRLEEIKKNQQVDDEEEEWDGMYA
ncbi:hypothetical protein PMZ80_000145 [Knufia obscura]|uniref:RING-type domain-containing protein n=2 Tax=Knufia TaxID=430999 RepID=A0AAN8EZ24_9EURO|nr:hypothetical protein PMZ80_000145 [Knufia obscura]KAK5956926.1 hypothetical protein OHC33_002415 [Knufia fluminis]